MRRILRFVLGLRPDHRLSDRWWHRLFKVSATLAAIGAGVSVMATRVTANRSHPSESSVTITETLREFAKKADPSEADVIPAFLRSPGTLGGRKNGNISQVSEEILRQGTCSADLSRHTQFIVDKVEPSKTAEEREELARALREMLIKEDAASKSGTEKRYCLLTDFGFSSDNVVKYELTTVGRAYVWALSMLETIGILLAAFLVTANLYYRGLVYIIYGPPA